MAFSILYEETIFTPAPCTTADEPDAIDVEKANLHQVETLSPERPPIRDDIPMRPYRERLALFTRTGSSFKSVFRHTYQPFIILATFPGVAFVALVYGSLLAWLAIVLNVQATYFTLPPYNFSSSGVGLLNIPTLLGCILGGYFGGHFSDYTIKWLARRNGGLYEPEMRLWLAFPSIVITPAGYLMFGLSIAKVKEACTKMTSFLSRLMNTGHAMASSSSRAGSVRLWEHSSWQHYARLSGGFL